ncbi:PREDICTED: probable N-acetyltransferase HLS1 [Nicotiana attenuata]|uniref:N-acetyltransferase hls1 n=1 Tax=Nicotiana attenuata TaxID=49451 RepID=A0A1J6I772_NICAT|nr:PREDICTED: probable N-acetyltransferase HLS1 [Nicotiana attenuata]OIT00869.1 putative n-acetyltransferase hls1 [Nicotiana attenuata]
MVKIRSYNGQVDRFGVEDLERRCEVGPAENVFLYTDTMGDPICRIRNSPVYNMLVAELNNEIVGVIQGTIKVVTLHKPPKNAAKVGYMLGLRVSPLHRRKRIGSKLVRHMEDWFISNEVDYAYMATEKDNEASVKLFVNKFGYVKFRNPTILIHPAASNPSSFRSPPGIEIMKLKVEQAEFLYRKVMSSMDFFPHDIDNILTNKLSLGTWVAYWRGESSTGEFGRDGKVPNSWAMMSVWDSGEIFKLRVGQATLNCFLYGKMSRLMRKGFSCFKAPSMPEFFEPFGLFFVYGIFREGPSSRKLVRTLCKFVHNLATASKDNYSSSCNKVVVTEIGCCDKLKLDIPHWKLLSCPEDLWCIKALKNDEDIEAFLEFTKNPQNRGLFVDPREV